MRDVFGLATAGFFADLAGEHRGQLAGRCVPVTRRDGSTAVNMTVRSQYRGGEQCFSFFRRFSGNRRSFIADSNLREVTRSATSHWLPALITVLGVKMILRAPRWVANPSRVLGVFGPAPSRASTDLRPGNRVEVGEVKE